MKILHRAQVAILVAFPLAALPVLAHHGASEYDMTKVVSLHATVTELQYVNPHTLLIFTVKDDSGKTAEWEGELPSPNLLSRRGWSRNSVKAGDQVTVIGALAKNGVNGMQIKKLVFPDGHELPGTVLPPDSPK